MYKEERDVSEEMRKMDECDTEEFDTPDRSEKAIAILGDKTVATGGETGRMYY